MNIHMQAPKGSSGVVKDGIGALRISGASGAEAKVLGLFVRQFTANAGFFGPLMWALATGRLIPSELEILNRIVHRVGVEFNRAMVVDESEPNQISGSTPCVTSGGDLGGRMQKGEVG